jgi:hypothetical protein
MLIRMQFNLALGLSMVVLAGCFDATGVDLQFDATIADAADSEFSVSDGSSDTDSGSSTYCRAVFEPIDDPVDEPYCIGVWCLDYPATPRIDPAAIGGTSDRDVWLLGKDGSLSHYDGTTWSSMPEIHPAPCGLNCPEEDYECPYPKCSLISLSTSDVWIAGPEQLWRFDGIDWQPQESPEPGLSEHRLWRVGEMDLWLTAVRDEGFFQRAVAYVLKDDTWLPRIAGALDQVSEILALDGERSDEVWAVDADGVLYWDGSEWVRPDIQPADRWRDSVVAFGPDDIWVGSMSGVSHFTGEQWEDTEMTGVVFGSNPDDLWVWDDVSRVALHFDGETFSEEIFPSRVENPDETIVVYSVFGGRTWIAEPLPYGSVAMWNGGWRYILGGASAPSVAIISLSGTSSNDLWAVVGSDHVLHRDENGWSVAYEIGGAWEVIAVAPNEAWLISGSRTSTEIYYLKDGQCAEQLTEPYGIEHFWAPSGEDHYAFWFVGFDENGDRHLSGYDGVDWSDERIDDLIPNPAPFGTERLWGTAIDEVWVGGSRAVREEGKDAWLRRWDGLHWVEVDLPKGIFDVRSFAGSGPEDLWINTSIGIWRNDGVTWTDVTPDNRNNERIFDSSAFFVNAADEIMLCSNEHVLYWNDVTWIEDTATPIWCPDWTAKNDDMWTANLHMKNSGFLRGVWRRRR